MGKIVHKFCRLWLCGALLFGLAGCATLDKVMPPSVRADSAARVRPLPPYFGPKAKLTVEEFQVEAAKAGGAAGSELREMLLAVLAGSDRYLLVEKQEPGAAGQAAEGQGIMISAAVSEFEPQASGGNSGIGGGGGAGSGAMGGLLGTALNKAQIALDIQVIDAATLEVLSATRIQGRASDPSPGFAADYFENRSLAGELSGYANTPMEKAIRICIIEAVKYITQVTPVSYYKY